MAPFEKRRHFSYIDQRKTKYVLRPFVVTVLFMVCFALAGVVHAQRNPLVDSMIQRLGGLGHDTLHVDMLNEIAWELTDQAPDQARVYLDSAYRHAVRAQFLKGQGNALNYRGVLESKVGRIDSAIFYFKAAVPIREALGDRSGMANLYNNIGIAYEQLGQFENALENYHRSLRIREEMKDTLRVYRLYYNIGDMYERMGNYPEAQDFILQYLEKMEALGPSEGVANAYNVLGNIHFEVNHFEEARDAYLKSLAMHQSLGNSREVSTLLNNLGMLRDMQAQLLYNENLYPGAQLQAQKAIQLYRQALAIVSELGDRETMAEIYHNIGVSLKDQGKFWKKNSEKEKAKEIWSEALSHLDTALQLCDTLLNKKLLLEIYEGYGDIYRQLKQYKTAVWFSSRSLTLAREIGDLKFVQEGYEDLYKLHYALKNYNLAFDYADSFNTIKTERYNQDRLRENARREVLYGDRKKQYEIERQQQEILLQDAELQQARIMQYSLFGGALALTLLALLLYNRYRLKTRANRDLAEKNDIIETERQRSEDLLLNILPEATAQELKQHGKAKAQRYDSVTVLFTDFKSFTQIAETLSPEELVAELDACFREFDRITEKYGVEKIKTIGDAYMCAGGLPVPNETHPFDVMNVALDMIAFMECYAARRRAARLPAFEIRIGIHTGPVVSGIVGSRKFAYDIWGDTVNLAARMESSGSPGKINISESVYELVKDRFHCAPRGKVAAKNKGEQEMFFVEGIRYQTTPGQKAWAKSFDWDKLHAFVRENLLSNLPANLTYHSPNHTEDVLQAARELCQLERVDHYHTLLIETAALFHDSGFTLSAKDHETYSCQLARERLPAFGFDEEAIKQICGMIMATRIPQNPQNHLDAILCDADLDYLGREDYEPIASSLREEWEADGNPISDETWRQIQANFLRSHRYFTRSSIQRRGENKERLLANGLLK